MKWRAKASQKINSLKSVFGKVNKTNEPLASLSKKKRVKTQIKLRTKMET